MALNDNLVAYWAMEEASGTRVDATGRGNDLAPSDAPSAPAGIVGSAVGLTLVTSLSLLATADIQTGDIAFTWAFWVWLDLAINNYDVLGRWASGQLEYDFYFPGTGSKLLTFFVSSTGSDFPGVVASSFGALTTGVWYFVVGWHDPVANTLNIVLNDGVVDSAAHSAGVLAGTATLLLGASNFVNQMVGRLDEVGLWKRVLTADERTFLYNGGAGRTYADLLPVATATDHPGIFPLLGVGD